MPEPSSADFTARLRAQELFCGEYIARWLLQNAPTWISSLHSYHIMRYVDPDHLRVKGIAVVLRFLGTEPVVASIDAAVKNELDGWKAKGAIVQYVCGGTSEWAATVLADYGGAAAAEPWARFLAASTWCGLSLLEEPSRDFRARQLVIENWAHCFRLITMGTG